MSPSLRQAPFFAAVTANNTMARSLLVALIAVTVACMVCADGEVNCKTGQLDATVKCFVTRDLSVTYMPNLKTDPEAVAGALILTLTDPLVQCEKPQEYQDAAGCFLEVLETCSHPPELVNILPSLDAIKRGMDAMCGEFYAADPTCMKMHNNRIQACSQQTVRQLLEESALLQTASSLQLTCLTAAVNYDCTNSVIGANCDAITLSAMLKIAGEYFVPRVCMTPSLSPAREGRASYVQLAPAGAGTDPNTATTPATDTTTTTTIALLFAGMAAMAWNAAL